VEGIIKLAAGVPVKIAEPAPANNTKPAGSS